MKITLEHRARIAKAIDPILNELAVTDESDSNRYQILGRDLKEEVETIVQAKFGLTIISEPLIGPMKETFCNVLYGNELTVEQAFESVAVAGNEDLKAIMDVAAKIDANLREREGEDWAGDGASAATGLPDFNDTMFARKAIERRLGDITIDKLTKYYGEVYGRLRQAVESYYSQHSDLVSQ